MANQYVHIIGGGTVYHVRPHLAISAVAYGTTARRLYLMFKENDNEVDRHYRIHLTKMANSGAGDLETNDDISALLDKLVANPETKVIILNAALCDFKGTIFENQTRYLNQLLPTKSGKDQPRLKTSEGAHLMELSPAEKLISKIRKERKDIFLVGFKTTAGATEDEMYLAGLTLLKTTSCNLVLVNDLHTKLNLIVAPELARYSVTTDRHAACRELVNMVNTRSRLTFTRTTIAEGALIPWDSSRVPATLRKVVDWCADHGAYKPFRDVTVGHFAFVEGPRTLISSRRKQNYNRRDCRDMVRVTFDNDQMTAYGAKPSAGTTSQYAVLSQFPEYDCIVHFHCPLKSGSKVNVRSQKDLECGSHECGENTWKGITKFKGLAAVMLDQHGPNIIFSSKCDPDEVIKFIDENFDLTVRSDGLKGGEEVEKPKQPRWTMPDPKDCSHKGDKTDVQGGGQTCNRCGTFV